MAAKKKHTVVCLSLNPHKAKCLGFLRGCWGMGNLKRQQKIATARNRSKKKLKKGLFAPPVRTPIIVNKSSRGRFRIRVVMPEDGLERRVVDGSPLGGRFYAALSSRGGSDFASSSGIDTFCPRLFFCSEVCRDARNAVALVFRSNHCENTSVSLVSSLQPISSRAFLSVYSSSFRSRKKGFGNILPEGTMMTINRMMMPTMMQIRIFMSFHHICLRTRLAPRRKPCADVARLSVLSCRASRRSPRCEALFRLSCIWRTVLSISYWYAISS
jgi:hypothetical protein